MNQENQILKDGKTFTSKVSKDSLEMKLILV